MSFISYSEYTENVHGRLLNRPSHWTMKKIKWVATLNDDVLPETTESEYEMAYVDIGSVSLDFGIEKYEFLKFKDAPSRARRIVKDGDVIVSTVRTYLKAIAPIRNPQNNVIVSTGFSVIRPKEFLEPDFLKYQLQSSGFIDEVISRSTGVSYPAINSSDIAKIELPIPPHSEQIAIAKFLDHEISKIDALVIEQEQLIELLKEKRQAVISNAVTKGLNPKVKMKASQVEWLGEVPEHWNVVPLKYFVSMKSGEQITSEEITDDGDFPVFGGNGLRGYFQKYTHDGQFPLIGRQGALCGNINYADGKFWASEHAVVVTPQKKTNIFYLGELLRSMNLGQYSTSAAQPGLSVEAIGNLRIPAPAFQEQKQIADYLMIEAGKWESLIGAATQSISLFQERRSALISAAVTGQIDVTNYQPKDAE